MSAAELLEHPEFKLINWALEPSKTGHVDVAQGRGGPFKLYYEVHGTGPTKIVTKDFGHDSQNKYSVLVLDNRGIGKSDKPFMRYSTSEMAKDLHEHLGWTSPRSLHVIGISMGGMIAQEFAYSNPELIGSVTFMSTAARLVNTVGFFENLWSRTLMLLPKSPDRQVHFASTLLFSDTWLWAPDEINGAFQYNRDRFAAGELAKRLDPASYTPKGFLLQAIAANWHHKSKEQLRSLADRVGRERIMVMHGDGDRMITVPHAHVLAAELGEGVKTVIYEDVGHCIPIERRKELVVLMDEFIEKTGKLGT